jgi:hypothetical protein
MHRLTATPTQELPLIAAYLASSLSDCEDILSFPLDHKSPTGLSDTALLVHKLKARIMSLLQDRSIEGRWTAVILVKATIEAGQWEMLRGSEPWVRALLAILSVRKVAILRCVDFLAFDYSPAENLSCRNLTHCRPKSCALSP